MEGRFGLGSHRIDISILYFAGDPNSTLELAEGTELPEGGSGCRLIHFGVALNVMATYRE